MICLVVLKKTDCCTELMENCLLGAGVLTPAMVGSTRSEKAKLEKEEREMAENTVWKVLIIIDMTAS